MSRKTEKLKGKKQKEYASLHIEAMSSEGLGIAKPDGKVVFVNGAIPGDEVAARVVYAKKAYEEANTTEIIQSSADRVDPFCSHFGICGGCKWQYAKYNAQLAYKENIVDSAFERLAKVEILHKLPIVGCAQTQYYRNKLEFTFSNKKWLTLEQIKSEDNDIKRDALGFHIPRLFDKIIDVDHCYLQGSGSNEIRNFIRDFAIKNNLSFYDIREQKGLLRTLIIKTTVADDVLVFIVYGENNKEQIDLLNQAILKQFSNIGSFQYAINLKKNDSIFDLDPILVSGKDHIIEVLGDKKYKIGPKSFFQTNPIQGKILYDITKEFAAVQKHETVYDLYTGVGSIALYVADDCKQVIGIEEVAPAIEDAKVNTALNQATNCHFYTGDVKKIIGSDLYNKHGKPDVIITDPPRAGMHEDVVRELLNLEANRIVYVSCNPGTQARDIALLNEKYEVAKMQAVDMFPHTKHIENIALLKLRTN